MTFFKYIYVSVIFAVIFAGMGSGIVLAQPSGSDALSMEEFLKEVEAQGDLPDDMREMLGQISEDVKAQGSVPAADEDLLLGLKEALKEVENASSAEVSSELSNGQISDIVIDELQLQDMDVIDVLKLLANKSRLNIIAGNNVKGKVSIYLSNVRLKDALRIILDANGLAYFEEDGIIHVMTAAEFQERYGHVFGGKIHTKIRHIIYAEMADVVTVLDQVKSVNGKVIADAKSNVVVLMDTEEKIGVMEELIAELDIPVETRVFELNYASSEELLKKLDALVTEGIGRIRQDTRSNKIIITDTPKKILQFGQMIDAFDIQDRQVLIEAKIVQITLTDSYELGVDWQAIFPGFDNLNVDMDFDVLESSTANSSTMQVGTIAGQSYSAMVEALQSVGETNILSSPSITVVNNEEAKILVGSTQPYVTTTTTTPASGPTTTAENISFIDVGVKLYVVPVVHKDGFITMKIRPEVSSVTETLTTSENNEIPIVETSEAETTVRIKDGVTIVIGGLIKDDKRSTVKKVPILGDIPLLGNLFRNQDDSSTKSEIAIFLTPHIMTGEIPTDYQSIKE